MAIVLSLIWRVIVIFFALFVALLASGMLIGFGLATGLFAELAAGSELPLFNDEQVQNTAFTIATFGFGLVASFQLAGLANIPVFLCVLVTELARWQNLALYFVLGGFCALFVLFAQLPDETTPKEGTIIVTLAAGFAASFFYWLIAGRAAGNWLDTFNQQNSDGEN